MSRDYNKYLDCERRELNPMYVDELEARVNLLESKLIELIEDKIKKLLEFEARCERYREALEFYAEEDRYFDADISSCGFVYKKTTMEEDFGKRAREALSKANRKEER